MKDELLQAYIDTDYIVPGLGLTIKVNERCEEADKYSPWAFVTACNPHSKSISEEENVRRNNELKEDLKDYKYYNAIGKGEGWSEDSFFVVGIKKDTTKQLMYKYEQNAFVFGEMDKAAELVKWPYTKE